MEIRRAPRFAMQGAIDFTADDRVGQASLINLSTGGCAAETETLLQKGEYLGLRVHLADQDGPVEVDLAAVRWTSGRELGLEFIRIREEAQHRLREMLPREVA